MKNSYSIAQRNALVEAHLSCINDVMHSNRKLIRAARLDQDDVYQQLALRLIKAQLRFELLDCRNSYRRFGITNAPKKLGGVIVSLDEYRDRMNALDLAMAA